MPKALDLQAGSAVSVAPNDLRRTSQIQRTTVVAPRAARENLKGIPEMSELRAHILSKVSNIVAARAKKMTHVSMEVVQTYPI